MFCPFCGEEIENSNRYCPYCGEELPTLNTIGENKSVVFKEDGDVPQDLTKSEDIATEIADLERELAELRPNIKVTSFNPNIKDWTELNSLIGLQEVKDSLSFHINNYIIQRERQRKHPELKQQTAFNSLFLGNPGTGKTTVARLVSGIMKQQGMLRGGQCVEVDATSLVSAWVGASAKSARLAALKAIDGVLFIDEAYALAGNGEKNPRKDVIDALTPIIENYRDRLVVILAGYDKEMDEFLKSVNTGFASRFQQKIHFDDYNAEELMTIFKMLIKNNCYVLSKDAERIATAIFQQIYKIRQYVPQFANARTVRNLFEKVCARASARIATSSRENANLDLIVAADLQLSKNELSAVIGLF